MATSKDSEFGQNFEGKVVAVGTLTEGFRLSLKREMFPPNFVHLL